MVDWGPALQGLGLGGNDFGPTSTGTYQELLGGWRGVDNVPAESVLLAEISNIDAASAATAYRKERKLAYSAGADNGGLGDDADVINTFGDVLDNLITQVEFMRTQSLAVATPEWSELLAKIVAIKIANPKP